MGSETQIGLSVIAEVTLYGVEIEGRGGDNVREAIHHTREAAVFASAIDGKNRTPTPFKALKFSDGTYGRISSFRIDNAPSEEEIAKLRQTMIGLRKGKCPAEALLFPED